MKLAFQLAYRNLIGAGLRTWLNVGVLAFAFIVIIFFDAIIDGWNQQAKTDSIAWDFGNGHLVHKDYDPYDPFSINDGHAAYPNALKNNLTPILIRQASIYPDGRMLSVALKGIDINQTNLHLPTTQLAKSEADIPAIIGKRMAKAAKLEKGDQVLLRWRDKDGTFDASKITIVELFDTDVPNVDKGQVWIPIENLWKMTGLTDHATLLVANENYKVKEDANWTFSSQDDLLSSINKIIASKKAGNWIMYAMLLGIALLALFDTQVLSVFRRQKEIGSYIALGMTRLQVVKLFTVEGAMYSIFAMFVGLLIGTPLFMWLAKEGIMINPGQQDMGIAMADVIYPVVGLKLILTTILLVVIAATIVSFLPARKIARMNPVDALKGKLQ